MYDYYVRMTIIIAMNIINPSFRSETNPEKKNYYKKIEKKIMLLRIFIIFIIFGVCFIER